MLFNKILKAGERLCETVAHLDRLTPDQMFGQVSFKYPRVFQMEWNVKIFSKDIFTSVFVYISFSPLVYFCFRIYFILLFILHRLGRFGGSFLTQYRNNIVRSIRRSKDLNNKFSNSIKTGRPTYY